MKVLKIKFGTSGETVDACGIRFYGDIDSNMARFGHVGEMFSDPDLVPITQHQRVTLWFTFKRIRSYDSVATLLNDLMYRLKERGYATMISSIDELVDTTLPEYEGKPESKFPSSERIHGYNAARGFSATTEKTDIKSKLSIKEIETIQELVIGFSRMVDGNTLNQSM